MHSYSIDRIKGSTFIFLMLLLFQYSSSSAQCQTGGPCFVCNVGINITSINGGTIVNGSTTVNGLVGAGQTGNGNQALVIDADQCGVIELAVELDFNWDAGSNNSWFHGISFSSSPSWAAAEGSILPPNPGWIFQNSITGICSSNSYGPGYYWDPPGTACSDLGNVSSYNGTFCTNGSSCENGSGYLVDGDPSDNWGLDCTSDCPDFGFNLVYCPSTPGNSTEYISFFLTEDGETGGYNSTTGCVFLLNFPIQINSSGTQLADTETVCIGECVTLDAGIGCDTYQWSTGESSQTIDVCPTVSTDYLVTVTSDSGCLIEDVISVIVEDCCETEAGTLAGSDLCPGDSFDGTITGYNADPLYDQYVIIADASGVIIDIQPGDLYSVSSDNCEILQVISFNNHNIIGFSPVPLIGDNINNLDCVNFCCDFEIQQVSFVDDTAPVFTAPPGDESLDCITDLIPLDSLACTDDCLGSGKVWGIESGTLDFCTGGTITREWTAQDSCGNSASYTQSLSLSPFVSPNFINPPADLTVSCEIGESVDVDLTYDNGGSGICRQMGTISGNLTGTHDMCGGSYQVDWSFTDTCGTIITHTQNITVDPAPEAMILNAPADQTYSCSNIPTSFSDLNYDNNTLGDCSISGTISPSVTNNYDACGGTISIEWSATDPCGRTISHIQTITIDPAPEAEFSNLPSNETVDCDMIPTTPTDLAYTNNEVGACAISGTVSPTITDNSAVCGGTIEYEWTFTDNCGRTKTHTQVITINPAEEPSIINPPADLTVDCDNFPLTTVPDLNYSNGLTGVCEISGTISGIQSAFDPCLGVLTREWSGTDACGNALSHTQNILIDPLPAIIFENAPADITVTCDNIPNSPGTLNYSNYASGDCLVEGQVVGSQSGTFDVCGGVVTFEWNDQTPCGVPVNYTQTITVEPATEAVFESPPADITVGCDFTLNSTQLSYSNQGQGTCLIEGTATSFFNGVIDACGGQIIQIWDYTDECGRYISASQNITVDPAQEASFINAPADITVSCSNYSGTEVDLNYTNSMVGTCLIEGSVGPIVTGSYDACGGLITHIWNFTDECGRLITHQRDVLIEPAPSPEFVNPPSDITLSCDEDFVPPSELPYSNGETIPCEKSGTATPVTTQNGNVYTNVWNYTDDCTNSFITHTQTVTTNPALDVSLEPELTTICEGEDFDLATIVVLEQNGNNIAVDYYEGPTSVGGVLLTNLIVAPSATTIYTLLVTNDAGCQEELNFTIIVDEQPEAGEGGTIVLCENESANLFNGLIGAYDNGGSWIDIDNIGVNLDNPSNVSFNGIPSGNYTFEYTVDSDNSCPPDQTQVLVSLSELPSINVDSVFCTDGGDFYSLYFDGEGFDYTVQFGSIIVYNDGFVEVSSIPITESVELTITDPQSNCGSTLIVNPPDCDCPTVPLPIFIKNYEVCLGSQNPLIEVVAVDGTSINWYNQANGGTLLAENESFYLSPETAVGVYTYYAESESIEYDGCVSNQRVPVKLEILSLPISNDVNLAFCSNEDCIEPLYDLASLVSQLTPNQNNSIEIYYTEADRMNQTNEVDLTQVETCSNVVLYGLIINAKSCTSEALLTVSILEDPILDLVIEDETCDGENDGEVAISIDPANEAYNIILNGVDYDDQNLIENLEPNAYTLSVENMNTGCTTETTFDIEAGISLDVIDLTVVCDNNGTDADSSDDISLITFTITNSSNASGLCNVIIGGIDEGNFNYNEELEFTHSADGSLVNIIVMDVNSSCIASTQIGPLNPCSTNCLLSLDDFTQVCDDNGTPSDSSDDFYTLSFQVSATNGSNANTYVVLSGANTYGPYDYDVVNSLVLDANGNTPILVVTDSEDNQCSLTLDVSALNPCSDDCLIVIENITSVCDNAGTEDDILDDVYNVTIDVLAINQSSTNTFIVWVGNDSIGEFTYPSAEFDLPANGEILDITIYDTEDPNCTSSIEIGPLSPCSSACSLSIVSDDYTCNDNGSPTDPSDDHYIFSFMIQSLEGSPDSVYSVFVDGDFLKLGNYSQSLSFQLPATGEAVEIQFIDNNQEFCTAYFQSDVLIPCSNDCDIQVELIESYCDNNNTNNIESDDVFYYVIEVIGSNVSQNWEISSEGITGKYNTKDTIGPFLIANGNQVFTISDALNNSCPIEIDLIAPEFCSMCEQVVSAGSDKLIDCATPSVVLDATTSEVGIYVWNGPNGYVSDMLNPTVTQQGWYYLEVNFDDGCSQNDSVEVTAIGEIPIAMAGEDQMLTCDVTEVMLIADYISSYNVEATWYDSDGPIGNDFSIVINSPGEYYVMITDIDNNCISAPDFVKVLDNTDEPIAVIYANPGNVIDCIVGSIDLMVDKQENVLYSWIGEGSNTTGTSVTVYGEGMYYVLAVDTLTGCETMDSIEIQDLTQFPIINVEELETITCINETTLIDISNSFPINGVEIIWYDENHEKLGEGPTELEVSKPGIYYVEIIDVNSGCSDIAEIEVEEMMDMPIVIAGEDGILPCIEDQIELSITTSGGPYDFHWTSNNGQIIGANDGNTIMAGDIGSYDVVVTNLESGCDTTINLVVMPNTNIPELIQCDIINESCYQVEDGEIIINDIIGGTAPYSIYFNNDLIDEDEMYALEPGSYYIEIIDAMGCGLDTTVIIQTAKEIHLDAPGFIEIQEGDDQQINVTTDIPEDKIDVIMWQPATGLSCTDCLNPFLTASDVDTYVVTIIDINGCQISETIEIRLLKKSNVYVPNVFSPNGDGVNEGFTVYSKDIVEITSLKVFDRWGELMFENNNFPPNIPSEGWKGDFKTRPVMGGVYSYLAKIKYENGSEELLSGDITVVK